MKTSIQLLFTALICSVVFSLGCRKEVTLGSSGVDLELSKQVIEWLNNQKQNNSADRITRIELLQASLELDKLWVEKGSERQEFIIVPIKESVRFINNKNKKVSNYLIVATEKATQSVTGYIIQNRNSGSATNLKKGNFSNICNNRDKIEDCNLTFISIFDRFMFETNYKDGRLYSIAVMNKDKKNPGTTTASNTSSQCTDWFLVTTYHYADGSTYQTSEYVGTTCNDCAIGDPLNESLVCDNGSGNSGSGIYSNEELMNMFDDYTQISVPSVAISTPLTTEGTDPVSDIFTWTVAKAALGGWSILANTQYSYYHYKYYIIASSSIEDVYDITQFKTTSTSYQGSNTLIESKWTQSPGLDRVLNNNSKDAVGKSKVVGTIEHKLLPSLAGVPIIGPILNAVTLKTIDHVSNEVTMYPK